MRISGYADKNICSHALQKASDWGILQNMEEKKKIYDLIVIGGGAGGLAAAVTAAKRGKKVIILEKEDKLGKKILVSGNGKCNLGNLTVSADKYNAAMTENVIKRDITAFFASLGLATKTAEDRIYPYSESALAVLNTLRRNYSGEAETGVFVKEIEERDGLFFCGGKLGRNVLLATGSAATKGTESAYLYEKFGHSATPFYPSLVPLVTDTSYIKGLSGLRAKCAVKLLKNGVFLAERRGEILFRDKGISGIAAMSLSTFIARERGKGDFSVSVDFVPDRTESEVSAFSDEFGAESFLQKAIAQNVEKQARDRRVPISAAIKDFRIGNVSCGDMKQAQVACGGLCTDEFDENLQSKIKKGLYACGEVLDVDGECGGFNLHFAFASGIRVGESVC